MALIAVVVQGLLSSAESYREWADEEAVYILTQAERAEWGTLVDDADRAHFVANFWLRRDPTPDTDLNEFRVEHYRRIAYVNKNFAFRVPGWRTDRGKVYVMFGPPDRIQRRAGDRIREIWRYRWIEYMGPDVTFRFLNRSESLDYRLESAQAEDLRKIQEGHLTLWEQLGLSSAPRTFTRTDGEALGIRRKAPK